MLTSSILKGSGQEPLPIINLDAEKPNNEDEHCKWNRDDPENPEGLSFQATALTIPSNEGSIKNGLAVQPSA